MAERSNTYQIRDRLAKGGMADIFLAIDRNDQYVALRRLREDLARRWGTVRQFAWGNDVITHLNHINIIRYIDSGKTDGLPWVVMEYVNGPNLRELLVNEFNAVKQHTMSILLGMAAALNHVHEHGYLHLDFKPENILVTKDFVVKLIDFDLCLRREDKPIKLKKLSGTPAYLAPEQISKKIVDERTDIFSFGVAAYEVLTGRKPVTGTTLGEVYQAYMNMEEEIRPAREFNKDIPLKLDRTIFKCLARDPERRYPVMSLVLRDLRAIE